MGSFCAWKSGEEDTGLGIRREVRILNIFGISCIHDTTKRAQPSRFQRFVQVRDSRRRAGARQRTLGRPEAGVGRGALLYPRRLGARSRYSVRGTVMEGAVGAADLAGGTAHSLLRSALLGNKAEPGSWAEICSRRRLRRAPCSPLSKFGAWV